MILDGQIWDSWEISAIPLQVLAKLLRKLSCSQMPIPTRQILPQLVRFCFLDNLRQDMEFLQLKARKEEVCSQEYIWIWQSGALQHRKDISEIKDLSTRNPEIVREMLSGLRSWRKTKKADMLQ